MLKRRKLYGKSDVRGPSKGTLRRVKFSELAEVYERISAGVGVWERARDSGDVQVNEPEV